MSSSKKFVTEKNKKTDESQFPVIKSEEDSELPEKEDLFDNSPRPVLTSLIVSGKEISVPSSCQFDTKAFWHPNLPFVNSYRNEGILPVKETKEWLYNNFLETLTDQEGTQKVMAMENDELLGVVATLSKDQFERLAIYCSQRLSEGAYKAEWNVEMWNIGFSLFSELGMVRLGVVPLPDAKRLWVGRDSVAGSRQIQFRAARGNFLHVGLDFVRTFIGQDAHKKSWSLQHRGGLWRIVSGKPRSPSYIYIEEFDNDLFQ